MPVFSRCRRQASGAPRESIRADNAHGEIGRRPYKAADVSRRSDKPLWSRPTSRPTPAKSIWPDQALCELQRNPFKPANLLARRLQNPFEPTNLLITKNQHVCTGDCRRRLQRILFALLTAVVSSNGFCLCCRLPSSAPMDFVRPIARTQRLQRISFGPLRRRSGSDGFRSAHCADAAVFLIHSSPFAVT